MKKQAPVGRRTFFSTALRSRGGLAVAGVLGAVLAWMLWPSSGMVTVLAFAGLVVLSAALGPMAFGFALQGCLRQPLPPAVPWLLAGALLGAVVAWQGLPLIAPDGPAWASWVCLGLGLPVLASFFSAGAAVFRRCFPRRWTDLA